MKRDDNIVRRFLMNEGEKPLKEASSIIQSAKQKLKSLNPYTKQDRRRIEATLFELHQLKKALKHKDKEISELKENLSKADKK